MWIALGAVVAQWIVSGLGPLSLLILVIVPVSFLILAKRRWFVVAGLVVVASPLSVSFAKGIVTWYQGDGYMMGTGYRTSAAASIDSFTRLPQTTSGCLVNGNEWVVQTPYNFALRLMTAIGGISKRAYEGPVPTELEARAALVNAVPLGWDELSQGRVQLHGRNIQLATAIGAALIYSCYDIDPLRDQVSDSFTPTIRATIWKDQVMVIGMRGHDLDLGIGEYGFDKTAQVIVIDTKAGKPFAYFAGHRLCDGLPLVWQDVGPRLLDMDLRTSPPSIL